MKRGSIDSAVRSISQPNTTHKPPRESLSDFLYRVDTNMGIQTSINFKTTEIKRLEGEIKKMKTSLETVQRSQALHFESQKTLLADLAKKKDDLIAIIYSRKLSLAESNAKHALLESQLHLNQNRINALQHEVYFSFSS